MSEADDEDDGEVDGDNNQCTMEIQYNKDNTSDCESSDELDLDDDFFGESQDIYANNCLISLAKKW